MAFVIYEMEFIISNERSLDKNLLIVISAQKYIFKNYRVLGV